MPSLLLSPSIRKAFLISFQLFRISGKFEYPPTSFSHLTALLSIFLDTVFHEKDSLAAKKIMILLFTFYHKSDNDQKIYLFKSLKTHAIWQEIGFWEAAALSSLREQNWDLMREKEAPEESEIREKNLIFSQLAAFSHNMLLFEVPKNIVKEVIGRLAGFCGLFELQISDLELHADNFGKNMDDSKKLLSVGLSYLYQEMVKFDLQQNQGGGRKIGWLKKKQY